MCHIQNFNAFTPVNKSVGKRQGIPSGYYVYRYAIMSTSRHVNVTARNHDDKPTGRHDVPPKLAKEEKASGDTDCVADFKNGKAIAH